MWRGKESSHAEEKQNDIRQCQEDNKTPAFQCACDKNKNGRVLTDQDQVRWRWREHFQDLYNLQTVTDQTVLDELPV